TKKATYLTRSKKKSLFCKIPVLILTTLCSSEVNLQNKKKLILVQENRKNKQ
ncbi:hypothetical protein C2G38_2057662, partial [Gigaspora rosea]